MLPDLFKSGVAGIGTPISLNQVLDFGGIATDTQSKNDFAILAMEEGKRDLHGGAGVQAGTGFSGETSAFECSGAGHGAVSADKFATIAGIGVSGIVNVNKRNSIGKIGLVIVSGEECAAFGVEFGGNVQR